MGFLRQGQPEVWPVIRDQALRVAAEHVQALMASEAAFIARTSDPFNVDNSCIAPQGHEPMASCGEIVCAHCARIFWR